MRVFLRATSSLPQAWCCIVPSADAAGELYTSCTGLQRCFVVSNQASGTARGIKDGQRTAETAILFPSFLFSPSSSCRTTKLDDVCSDEHNSLPNAPGPFCIVPRRLSASPAAALYTRYVMHHTSFSRVLIVKHLYRPLYWFRNPHGGLWETARAVYTSCI